MKNSSYWQNRFEQLEEAQHTSNVRKYAEIQEQFNIAERTINNQINAWYGRFADANGVSISEARRMLDAKEMAELKWDVQQYIKYGQENALNEKWMKELESASARAHISRLEALRLRTQSECEKLYGNLTDDISDHIASQYEKAYYHTAFEVAKGTNKGANFAALDSKKVEKLIQKPWAADGKNFAIRLGENKANLIDSVYKNVVQMSLTGSGPDKAIESLSKVMNNDKVRASRIIMTESAYFSELAHRDTFRELGVEKYEIVATLDSRTSEICQEMDGKVFDMKVFEPGVTAPPFHPNCRSTTVPYYEDDYDDIGERAARDEEGNTYYVPANITYKEWEKKYVVSKQDTEKKKMSSKAKAVGKILSIGDFPQAFSAKSEQKNTQLMVDYINNLDGSDSNVLELYGSMAKMENLENNGIDFKISHSKDHYVRTSIYRSNNNLAEVTLSIPKLSGENLAGQINTTLHEEMHLIDVYGRPDAKKAGFFSSNRKALVDAVDNAGPDMSDDVKALFDSHDSLIDDVSDRINKKYFAEIDKLQSSYLDKTFEGNYNDYKKAYNKLKKAREAERDYEMRNILGGGIGNLEDIYDALSGGAYLDTRTVKYGHGSSTYKNKDSRIHEIVANYGALSVTRPDLIELLRKDKPQLVEELDKTIMELLERVD